MLTTHNIDIQAMLVWLTLPFYDFCGFRSVAVNSVYKLQFFTFILCISQSAQAWITQFYLQIHHACLSFVSVHQMAPPLTEVRDIQLQLTTYLSTPEVMKG